MHFPLGWEPFQIFYFLIISFDFLLVIWRRGLQSLLILWRSATDWNWRISRACFRVSSATHPALMALERVRSDSLKSLSREALSFVKNYHIFNERVSKILEFKVRRLTFSVKSWKLWPSSCLYVINLWRRMVTFFLGLQCSENLFKTVSIVIWSSDDQR